MVEEKNIIDDVNKEEHKMIRFEPSALGESVAIKRQAKVDHGEQWIPHPCLSIILGRSGCGKSYILGAIAPKIRELCHVVVLTPIVSNPVYQALGDYFTNKDIRFEICGDIKRAQDVLGEAMDKQEEGKYGLCIMDDMNSGQRGSTSCTGNNVLTAIYTKIRNYNWHCFILCQDISFIPTRARTNANMWVIFQQNNTYSVNQIMRDLPNLIPDVSIDELHDLFYTLKQDRHAFMLASVCNDDVPRVYVANRDTKMKLRPVEFDRYNANEDAQLAKISHLMDERGNEQTKRLIKNYLNFIKNQYGEGARNDAINAYPNLRFC